MSSTQNKSGYFEPIHAAHAIEQVVFVLQFDTPLSDEIFAQVQECAKQFETESDLPRLMKRAGISISFSPAGQSATVPSQKSGFMLRRMRADGSIEKELRVEPDSIAFMTSLYTRWDAIWVQAKNYFSKLAPIYAANSKIVGIGLNYVDKFIWTGDKAECSANALLRTDSKYLCPQIFEAQDFWHSHTGAFIRADEQTKRLLNVNVDHLEENRGDEMRRVVSVITVLTDMLNQPDYIPAEVSTENIDQFLDKHATGLHLFGKEVLGNIINDEMSKRIALGG
ncbi:MAG: TIGR04255 family protein [Sideroxydans sp.]|nr:TIGR04255 family protein [Sideroxydans sp.]